MAQMKATDIKDKILSHSSQNLRGRTLIFLAIYVLETCGPVAPHCARMTNFMKHQKKFSSQCTTSPIFKLISTVPRPKRQNRLIPCKTMHSPSLSSPNKRKKKGRESVFPCMVSTGFDVSVTRLTFQGEDSSPGQKALFHGNVSRNLEEHFQTEKMSVGTKKSISFFK